MDRVPPRLRRAAGRLRRQLHDRGAPGASETDRPVDPAEVEAALQQRLGAIAAVLLADPFDETFDDAHRYTSVTFGRLVAAVHADPTPERVWLLLCGLTAAYPSAESVLAARRVLELCDPVASSLRLLDDASAVTTPHQARRRIELVCDTVVVDVDQSARSTQHTGVKEVVRSTLPLWAADHELTLAAWADDDTAWRPLASPETDRVLRWRDSAPNPPGGPRPGAADPMLVPYRCVLVLPDIATSAQAARLDSLATNTENRVVAIGYDCIPVVSADLVPWGMAGRFVSYLTVVKHMRRVAAISSTAAAEFEGFVAALPTQGLSGPAVVVCALPSPAASPRTSERPDEAGVSVLMVGSFEPRKNHLAVLHACEILWQEGLSFELVLIGGMSWGDEVPARIAVLRRRGRRIVTHHAAAADVVEQAYQTARFTVFPSLHEGYGLPVAESLAAGTPVITSDFGSTAEVAAGGGALMIDPRDDEALIAAMRRLLTDDAELHRLRSEITSRPSRSWSDYADDLWRSLVQPELDELGLR